MTKLQSLIDFAGGHSPDEEYDYMNIYGSCAMGQWMAATNVAWDCDAYHRLCSEIFGSCHAPLAEEPHTWGALHQRLQAFADA